MLAVVAEKYLMDGMEEDTKADFVKRLGRRVEDEDETLEQRRGEKLRRGRKVELMLTKIWAGQLRSASGSQSNQGWQRCSSLPRLSKSFEGSFAGPQPAKEVPKGTKVESRNSIRRAAGQAVRSKGKEGDDDNIHREATGWPETKTIPCPSSNC